MSKSIGVIISISIILSAFIFGLFLYNAQYHKNSVRVVGYASMEYPSDIARWQVSFYENTGINDLGNGYKKISKTLDSFKSYLSQINLPLENLSIRSPYTYSNYSQSGQIIGYNIEQTVIYTIQDTSLFKFIEYVNNKPDVLFERGVKTRNSTIEYYISELPQLKHNIIAEATKDARIRANKVAESGGNKIGKVLSARVGVFQITEPLSTEVQSYGIYNTSTRQKQISVTVTTEFEIK